MQNFVEVHLKPQPLARYGLPDIAYPVPVRNVQAATTDHGELPLAAMLHGLQQRSRHGDAGWQDLEPAMERLAKLLTPDDEEEDVVTAAGDNWWLEIGPLDLNGKLVTIQRADSLIAAITARDDGRLRVAVYRPLDAKSAGYLIALGQTPHLEGGVAMRENNWEYALDASVGARHFYAAERGEAYLSFWEKGIGIDEDGREVPGWRSQMDLVPRRAAVVPTELRVHYKLSSEEDAEHTTQPEKLDEPIPSPPAWRGRRQQRRTVQGRFLGCLLGGAVGDALGAPVEFMKRSEILRLFGPNGITAYAPAYGGIGRITDDTQMTLFTAEGLLRSWVRGCFKGIWPDISAVTRGAYLRWLQTQGERPRGEDPDSRPLEPDGWLFKQKELHSRRAPGLTCLSALKGMSSAWGAAGPAANESKGCGAVMRIAPVGLFAWRWQDEMSPEKTFRLAADLAALTHGHPTAALTAGVFAVLIMALTDGASLLDGLSTAKEILRRQPDHEETLRAIEQAMALAESDLPRDAAISELGEGWVAEEAFAISVYCALVARTFKEGVILAVNHDGDSDSTGSITGNLLGTMHGAKAIPQEWLVPLELRDVIAEVAEDLYAYRDWDIGDYSDNELSRRIWQKYPGF